MNPLISALYTDIANQLISALYTDIANQLPSYTPIDPILTMIDERLGPVLAAAQMMRTDFIPYSKRNPPIWPPPSIETSKASVTAHLAAYDAAVAKAMAP